MKMRKRGADSLLGFTIHHTLPVKLHQRRMGRRLEDRKNSDTMICGERVLSKYTW